jgi:hypothetical protein
MSVVELFCHVDDFWKQHAPLRRQGQLGRGIPQHRVFAGLARRGKTSVGWFFGFKLHLVFNDRGELLNMQLTPGNIDDREPVPDLVQELFGKLFADKGYISQALGQRLRETCGLQLITQLKKNMKNRLLPLADKLLLRKRAIVETSRWITKFQGWITRWGRSGSCWTMCRGTRFDFGLARGGGIKRPCSPDMAVCP